MKKILLNLLFISITLLSFTSCSEELFNQKDPNRESSDTYWEKEEDFQQALNAAYSQFRVPGYFSRWYHVLMISRSDEGWSESPNPYFQAYSNFNISSYNDDNAEGIIWPWQAIWRQIFYANQIIDNIKLRGNKVFAGNESARDKILAQAYAIRGTAYWYLAVTFGKGPLMLSSTEKGEVVDQLRIYEQSLSDYLEAEKGLPERWYGDDQGRITLGGAKGMAARVYMQLAGYYRRPNVNEPAKSQQALQNAKTKIEELLALEYSLAAEYKWNFDREHENNANPESIFEIQFNDGLFNGKELGMQRPKFLGLVVEGAAWADAYPRKWLLDEFRKETDKEGNVDKRLDVTLFYEKPGDTVKYYGKTWAEWNQTEKYKLTQPCYWRKYTRVDDPGVTGEDYSCGINFRFLRLADVYLMYAEVLNELDQERTVAVEYINKVRRRANMSDLNPANFTDKNTLAQQIMHERLVELCGEATRWFDLERWGYLHDQNKVNILAIERDIEFANFKIGVSSLFPIPNRELGLYPGLTQNPGY
ncbi:MAG: RagB/SusD family nutrient uptake outer membrane protein [Bacteroidales bacterium]